MQATKFDLESNKKYWEDPSTISIIDSNLHQLEIDFVSKYLRPDQVIADIGCGSGSATVHYAQKVKKCYALERSKHLRETVKARAESEKVKNIDIREADILNLDEYSESFDLVVTQRVIINLPTWELQQQALANVHRTLKPGGLYVMLENTHDANDILTDYRSRVGLPPIPIHWHNEFLDLDKFLDFQKDKFELLERHGFNLYYLLSRVYVQMFASFTGSGKDAVKEPIFDKADAAARILTQQIGDSLEFKDNAVIGPIQGFAFRKR